MSIFKDNTGEPSENHHALKTYADIALRLGRYGEAEALLVRALAVSQTFDAARFSLATAMMHQGKFEAALRHLELLLGREPYNVPYLSLKALALARLALYDAAIESYDTLLHRAPTGARTWIRYGHVLRAVGRSADCIAAYRNALTYQPTLGEAWWSLADLKTVPFDAIDVRAMTTALAKPCLQDEDRIYYHFALGKAMEDEGMYSSAFHHYTRGNAIRRASIDWDADANRKHVFACEKVLTKTFFQTRQKMGCQKGDPIFVVGLPRSGSTLIEQILASHSRVEGTMELPDLAILARHLAGTIKGDDPSRYLSAIVAQTSQQLTDLGEAYVRRTRIHRMTSRRLFVDKMPNNFQFVGLIHLILPNAKIIDARRNPMATCFSAWKQLFAAGQNFTYDLRELGRYYNDYVRLMDHFDHALPGRVLRVFHEDLVNDTEVQIRRLLDYCDLQFEPACLDFHRNSRPVRTSSSEQVRRPISSTGLRRWRNFEPWLGALKAEIQPFLSDDAFHDVRST